MSRDLSSYPPLRIIAYSDFYTIPEPRVWGDYWLKHHLLQEFKRIGYPLSEAAPRIVLHLFGEPLRNFPEAAANILWIHSHPDWVTSEMLRTYDRILCISPSFIRKIGAMGIDAGFLMVPTAMAALKRDKKYDIVFVGNTKQNSIRKIIRDMGEPPCGVKIWGWGWRGLIPDGWYGGEYYENEKLSELYASAKIVLNDHHDDMRREGFLNPRILDVLASGGFVISDRVRGMEELLGKSVPSYETTGELRDLIGHYLRDSEARELCTKKGKAEIRDYTYETAAREIIRQIESISDKLFV